MKVTYLDEYIKTKRAYLPIGTFEWHGNHLPLETDAITAEFICREVAKEYPGFVIDPLYLATDAIEDGKRGMERHLGNRLTGEIYYLSQELFISVLDAMVKNLLRDFDTVVVVTGHAGSGQISAINKVAELNPEAVIVNPFKDIAGGINHADEFETSLFWACRPEEEQKSREMKIGESDEYFKWLGYDPRTKASLDIGEKILKTMVETTKKDIKNHSRV